MNELIVIGYDTPEKTEAARAQLLALSKEFHVDVADAVVAVCDREGRIKLNQMVSMWTVGTSGGAFWGLLAGLLFFHPLVGAPVGAAVGAVSAALSDYGIKDDFMREVSKVLHPRQAALFLMMRGETSDRIIDGLILKGGHLLRTNLDPDKETKVRHAFDAAHVELNEWMAKHE